MNISGEKLKRYFQRTYKNKVYALVLITTGIFSTKIAGDSVFLILALFFGVPLFLTDKEIVEEDWAW